MLLNNYISKQVLVWTLISTAALIGIVWLSQALRLIELLVNRGAEFGDFVLLSILTIPLWLVVILPAATLFATMLVLNNLQQDREITALSSIGLSNLAIARGPLLVGAAVSLFLLLNSAFLLPLTFSGYKTMISNLRTAAPIVVIQEGVFTDITKGLTVFIREKEDRYRFKTIFVSDRRDPEKHVEVVAEGGFFNLQGETPQLVFRNGMRSELVPGESRAALLNFDRYVLELTSAFRGSGERVRDYNELDIPTLLAGRHSIEKYSREMRAEGHFRLASPLLGLAMVVIGAGAILNRQYARATSWRMMLAGAALAIVVQVGIIAARGLAIDYPPLYPLLYAVGIVPTLLGLSMMRQPAESRRRGA